MVELRIGEVPLQEVLDNNLEEGRDRHTLDQTSSITAEASSLNQTNRREAKRNQDMETTGNLKVPVIY